MGEGFAAFQEQLRSLRDNVTRLLTTLKPDVIPRGTHRGRRVIRTTAWSAPS